jgi:leucine-rich repeat protein SHOC2
MTTREVLFEGVPVCERDADVLHEIQSHLRRRVRAALPAALLPAGPTFSVLPIGEESRVVVLNLAGLQVIDSLPDLAPLTALRRLILSANRLRSLPLGVTAMDELRVLDLANNLLVALSSDVGSLGSLASLTLDGNPLTVLPAAICRLQSLRVLSVRNARLSALPDEIGELEHLESLRLEGNAITRLPESMGRLARLRVLDLQKNPCLTELPPSLATIPALEALRTDLDRRRLLPALAAIVGGPH